MNIFDDDCPLMMEREFGAPEGVPQIAVGFCMVPKEDKHKSKAAGYPVFRDKEYVKKIVPGDKNSEYFQPAKEEDRKTFPNAYQAFKNRESKPVVEGMPIEQWPQVTRALAMTLRAAGVHTVEALAAVHDGNISKIASNGQELRAKAQAFLATAKDAAQATAIAAENQKLKDQLAAMQEQINALAKIKKQKAA
jgi:FtsZ-binding cell division protein ZapB